METKILPPTDITIKTAASLILTSQIVAFPTETVYGLGASIFDDLAIRKIFEVKGRPADNPLIAHISSLSQVKLIAQDIPAIFDLLTDNFFPGPLTLVVPKMSSVPDSASANLPTIGIRMPNHQVAWKLIDAVGVPLVAPSANLSGKPSPTTAQHVFDDLQGKISLIIDGGSCEVGIESTVLDITQQVPVILRPGHISKQQLETVLQRPVLFSNALPNDSLAKAPGMKYRHYAPNAHIHIVSSLDECYELCKTIDYTKSILLSNVHLPLTLQFHNTLTLTETTLYANFRLADDRKIQDIIILLDEETKKNSGLMNRIEKANLG